MIRDTFSSSAPMTSRRGPVLALASLVAAGMFGTAGLLLWGAGGGFSHAGTVARTISPGMTAPDFRLPTADKRAIHLADYKGRAVFLAFVPSWDDTKTLAEVRSLRATTPQFDNAGAKVMLVGPDDKEGAARLQKTEKLPFPALIDKGGELARQFGVPAGLRTTFVVTPEGSVKYRVGDTAVESERHGPQLLDVSKCCLDEVMAARAHGIGRPVGNYSLLRVNGASAAAPAMETLYGHKAASVTVVLFLSAKCPCSNSYNDRIREWATRYEPRGVRFVGVYANQDETTAAVAAHAREKGFTFPVFRDEKALCADHFGAGVTPECFVLDGSHTLRYAGRLDNNRDRAQATTHELTDALDALLSSDSGKKMPSESRAFGCGIIRTVIP